MGLFVKNNYVHLLVLPLLIWTFSSCARSENVVKTVEETEEFKEESPKSSNGWIQIGSKNVEMTFTCYETQLGEVAAIGNGEDPETGESTEALIQAFIGKPYVGLLKNGSTMFEASLNEPLDISVNGFDLKLLISFNLSPFPAARIITDNGSGYKRINSPFFFLKRFSKLDLPDPVSVIFYSMYFCSFPEDELL